MQADNLVHAHIRPNYCIGATPRSSLAAHLSWNKSRVNSWASSSLGQIDSGGISIGMSMYSVRVRQPRQAAGPGARLEYLQFESKLTQTS
jgi:hypothetical protein